MDSPPLANCINAADGMATGRYNKLQPRKAGPSHITEVQSHTVVINKDGVPNTVSVHIAIAVFELESNKNVQGPGTAHQGNLSETMGNTPRQQNDETTEDIASKINPKKEYALEKTVKNKSQGRRLQ